MLQKCTDFSLALIWCSVSRGVLLGLWLQRLLFKRALTKVLCEEASYATIMISAGFFLHVFHYFPFQSFEQKLPSSNLQSCSVLLFYTPWNVWNGSITFLFWWVNITCVNLQLTSLLFGKEISLIKKNLSGVALDKGLKWHESCSGSPFSKLWMLIDCSG